MVDWCEPAGEGHAGDGEFVPPWEGRRGKRLGALIVKDVQGEAGH